MSHISFCEWYALHLLVAVDGHTGLWSDIQSVYTENNSFSGDVNSQIVVKVRGCGKKINGQLY